METLIAEVFCAALFSDHLQGFHWGGDNLFYLPKSLVIGLGTSQHILRCISQRRRSSKEFMKNYSFF